MMFSRSAAPWRPGDEVVLGLGVGLAVGLMAAALLVAAREPAFDSLGRLVPPGVESRPGVQQSPSPPPARRAPAAAGDEALDSHTRRLLYDFTLNALLAPLLDDSGHPLRWADPRLLPTCGQPSRVEIDGAPVAVGQEWHGRAFTLRWQLDGCMPFGPDGPALDGLAELDVLPENEGLSAIVRFERMTARRTLSVELSETRFIARARWTF